MPNNLTINRNPIALLFISIGFAVAALFIFQFISLVILVPFSDMGMEEFLRAISNPYSYPEMRWNLMWMQGISAFGAFIMAPTYFIYRYEGRVLAHYFTLPKTSALAIVMTVFLTLAFMIVNGLFIEWNLSFQFPDGFHQWAWQKEEQLRVLTEFLTVFDHSAYFVVCFVVIAVLPAVGEELLFRGLIQKYAGKIFGNIHVAIWLTAVFFSAFHLQFFGFVPRMLLGAFFGYLFYFSGSLWYPIIAHFVNNGFTLLLIYFYQKGAIDYDIENTESIPLDTVAIFFIIGVVLFILFYRQFDHSSNQIKNENVKQGDG